MHTKQKKDQIEPPCQTYRNITSCKVVNVLTKDRNRRISGLHFVALLTIRYPHFCTVSSLQSRDVGRADVTIRCYPDIINYAKWSTCYLKPLNSICDWILQSYTIILIFIQELIV